MAINTAWVKIRICCLALIDEGNTISMEHQPFVHCLSLPAIELVKETSGMKVLDGKRHNKVITAMVWKNNHR